MSGPLSIAIPLVQKLTEQVSFPIDDSPPFRTDEEEDVERGRR